MINIETALLNYINSEYVDYAVELDGHWGIGKTYFINQFISKNETSIRTVGSVKQEMVYISLNGLQSIEDFKSRLLNTIIKSDKELIAYADKSLGYISTYSDLFNNPLNGLLKLT